ncbi:MAG: NfeD family protein, partial [bacterium]
TALAMASFFFFVVRVAMAARRLPVRSAADSVVGTEATVTRALSPTGVVQAGGESWTARALEGTPVPVGARVLVMARNGLVLEVVPLASLEVFD